MTLIDKNKNVNPSSASFLVSFDVIGFHTRIPEALALQVMGELFVTAGCYREVITEFYDLLRSYWSANFYQYNHKSYEFSEEVGIYIQIGSPSGLS